MEEFIIKRFIRNYGVVIILFIFVVLLLTVFSPIGKNIKEEIVDKVEDIRYIIHHKNNEDASAGEQENFTSSATLVDGLTFNASIPDTAKTVIFTLEPVTYDAAYTTDLSANKNGSILGYLVGDVYKISPKEAKTKIVANESCQMMFQSKHNLTSVIFENFDVSSTADFNMMFYNMNNVSTLDLSGFKIANSVDLTSMFFDCQKLEFIDLSSADLTNATLDQMFDTMKGKTNSLIVKVKDRNTSKLFTDLPSYVSIIYD